MNGSFPLIESLGIMYAISATMAATCGTMPKMWPQAWHCSLSAHLSVCSGSVTCTDMYWIGDAARFDQFASRVRGGYEVKCFADCNTRSVCDGAYNFKSGAHSPCTHVSECQLWAQSTGRCVGLNLSCLACQSLA